MSDWLSEIEADFEDENYPTRVDGERMARVLREFAKALKNTPHDHSVKDCYTCGLLKELSPDAKELLG